MQRNNVFPFPVVYNDEMLDSLMKSMFGGPTKVPKHFNGENDQLYFIDVALPGHYRGSVSVLAEEGVVYVDAKVNGRLGFLVEDYSFSFEIPAGCDESAVTATMLNGILSIKLPKPEAKSIQVAVK